MKTSFRRSECRNCGLARDPGELDSSGWCRSCRAPVLRRSAFWARVSAIVVALGLAAWIGLTMRPTRFLVAWMLVLAFTYVVVYKIVQRVAFEVIRSRGVAPAPEEADD